RTATPSCSDWLRSWPATRCCSRIPCTNRPGITKIACFPTGNLPLVVQSSMGVEDIEGFAAYARKHPVGIGTPGAGSYSHVATVELGKHLGVKLEPVHYRGESPALTDFLGGNLPAVNATWTISKDMIGSGKG